MPKIVRYQEYQPIWRLGQATVERLPAAVSRYLPCPIEFGDSIIHTSYYRLPARPVERYVVTAYDFMYERYRTGPARWVHGAQKRSSIACADIVSFISSFTRDEVLEFCPRVDPSRLKVVPLGVDGTVFYPDSKACDSALDRTVLFVGQGGGYKRFDLAQSAIRAVNGLKLGLVGPALEPQEVVALNNQLAGRWQHFGAVP